MTYLAKKLKQLMCDFDNTIGLPKKFDVFVKSIKDNQKLIIKSKDGYQCDACHNISKNLKTSIKSGLLHGRCPYCKKELEIKTNRIRHYILIDRFAILETFQNYTILRLFEVKTWYDHGNYRTLECEYGRKIFDNCMNCTEIYNDNVISTITGKFVQQNYFLNGNWKKNGSYYNTLDDILLLYPHNLNVVLKGTPWQYSQLKKYAKHFGYIDIEHFLRRCSDSTEMLIKAGLFNLAKDVMSYHGCYLSDKDYKIVQKHLKFIKKYNLDSEDIYILKFLNEENLPLIKKYKNCCYDISERIPENICVDLKEIDKRILNIEGNFTEYADYLRICQLLSYNMKDKNILYPEDAISAHDRVVNLYEVMKNKENQKKIKKRYNQIKNTTFSDDQFIIFPVKKVEELIDESKQQNNCVKTYASSIASGKCDIYFMRYVACPDKSLVTVEVKNHRVVQQRTKNNRDTTEEQKRFLKEWETSILKA